MSRVLNVYVIDISVNVGECMLQNVTHYTDIIMSAMASQITGVSIVYSIVCPGTDQRKYQSSASLACVCGIRRWPVNSLHKAPETRKMFPFDDVIMMNELMYDCGRCLREWMLWYVNNTLTPHTRSTLCVHCIVKIDVLMVLDVLCFIRVCNMYYIFKGLLVIFWINLTTTRQ